MSTVNKFKNRLQDKLKQQTQNKPMRQEDIPAEDNFKKIIDFSPIDELSEDIQLKEFLKENSLKLLSIQSKAVIETGKILEEVYEELARSGSREGIYTKWLEFSGIAPRTALNYRKRYSLHSKVIADKQSMVTLLPQKIIDSIMSSSEIDEYIKMINEGAERKELEIYFAEAKIKPSASLPKVTFEEFKVENFKTIFENIEDRIKVLDKNKQKEIGKYFSKIVEILEA